MSVVCLSKIIALKGKNMRITAPALWACYVTTGSARKYCFCR